jgi:hypothetical protein
MSANNNKLGNIVLTVIAAAGFLLTLVPSFLNWQGITGPERVNTLMIIGTVLWFGSASFLLGRKQKPASEDQEEE